jgi:hypothetical protein
VVAEARVAWLGRVRRWNTERGRLHCKRLSDIRKPCPALFAIRHGDKFKEYWKSCTKYLDELSRFRNAIAHWHPVVSIYVRDGPAQETLSLKGLQDPKLRYDLILGTKDFPPFIEDCLFIRAEFIQLLEVLKENRLDTLPEKYQQPITRTNLAVID